MTTATTTEVFTRRRTATGDLQYATADGRFRITKGFGAYYVEDTARWEVRISHLGLVEFGYHFTHEFTLAAAKSLVGNWRSHDPISREAALADFRDHWYDAPPSVRRGLRVLEQQLLDDAATTVEGIAGAICRSIRPGEFLRVAGVEGPGEATIEVDAHLLRRLRAALSVAARAEAR